ncbi:MAG: hypothetical protein GC162_18580 [Planctomycetes bacterium]|nr:hypothetical protein [Planctomycetota bacterium]
MRCAPCILLIALLTGVSLAGCSTAVYNTDYTYRPRPLEVPMAVGDQTQVRALATIVGLRNETDAAPAAIDVRLRLDNVTDQPARFDPAALALFDAAIKQFDPPTVAPAGVQTIAPGQSATIEAAFPLPGSGLYTNRGFDLDGLNLRWTVTVGSQSLSHSATFLRKPDETLYRPYPYYWGDPFYDPWIPYRHYRRH